MESTPLDPTTAEAQKEFAQQFGDLHPAGRGPWWPTLLVIMGLVVFFAKPYAIHMSLSANNLWFNDDARQQIWPLVRYSDEAAFPAEKDYIADYYLASFPIGYRGLYAFLSLIADPRPVSKVLPYALLAITALAVGRSARRLRGPPAGWAAVALVLGAHVYLERMAGGLPRSFAFPLLAVAMLALVRSRPLLLAIVTVLAAGFYPAAAVVCGLTLALWLILPASLLGKSASWSWPRRLLVLGVTAILTVAVVVPLIFSSQKYGGILRPSDGTEYPELSAAGRYHGEDRGDGSFSGRAFKNFLEAPLAGIGGDWEPSREGFKLRPRTTCTLILLTLGLAGFGSLLKTSPAARRALLLPLSAIIGYCVSAAMVPLLYLPSRYQLYALAIAAVVIVPAGIAHLASVVFARKGNSRVPQAIALFATAGLFLLFYSAWNLGLDGKPAGPSELASAGLYYFGEKPERNPTKVVNWEDRKQALIYISKLRPDAVIAGWPPDMDSIPYLTNHQVLVSRETHQAFHRAYADEMRRRVRAIIAALYDPNPESLQSLIKTYGVTHLIISDSLYGRAEPVYFAPFDADIRAARQKMGNSTPACRELLRPKRKVFGDWTIIDLTDKPD
jgi:hypothetical protein